MPSPTFALEYKFDGLTINLTYENGKLTTGATRGNGIIGETITEQVKTIATLPQEIPFKGRMEVQGECIMRLSVLEAYNAHSDEPLKNARNAAAGALRNVDPSVTAERHLDCFVTTLVTSKEKRCTINRRCWRFSRKMAFRSALSFTIAPTRLLLCVRSVP